MAPIKLLRESRDTVNGLSYPIKFMFQLPETTLMLHKNLIHYGLAQLDRMDYSEATHDARQTCLQKASFVIVLRRLNFLVRKT